MKEFDIEKLERKNIYTAPDNLFDNIQAKVLSGVNDFDLEKLERKNIYTVSENVFEDIQDHVINKVFPRKKAPIFKINWAYAAAASLALIFGATFVFNNDGNADDPNVAVAYTVQNQQPETESEKAYETLKSDLTSVENDHQNNESQKNKKSVAQNKPQAKTDKQTAAKTGQTVSKQDEAQMNDYLDSFSNSEISELASNSTQDVYLDLYN
ncbi:3-oxoacyl-ACP reductase-like protein [Chryseobacterium sp. SORGH_AS 447]|uniref:hypothetical protein n=1 Tax=Chryseobacterium sp. SORGH_AS_0447 TaxID=3041769 RepID=UPI002780A6DC|nr:hypothetical protein [Chryseobacterium sp. SORGH_AS_0447]MDQ1160049.1 3-oxoacyl-ACP reductase-like protein [Chryseobacterium sp. SORGH_AS_0447]